MKKANAPIDRIAACYANARHVVIARALERPPVLPLVGSSAAASVMLSKTAATDNITIIRQGMMIMAAGGLSSANKIDRDYPDAAALFSDAKRLVGLVAPDQNAIDEVETAHRRAQRLVGIYWPHVDKIARLLIAFDDLIESLPRHNQPLEDIDNWPAASTGVRPFLPASYLHDRRRFATCIHESGHLITQVFFHGQVDSITVSKWGEVLGSISGYSLGNDVCNIREELIRAFAGPIASVRGFPDLDKYDHGDFVNSYNKARSLYGKLGKARHVFRETKRAEHRAEKVVDKLWNHIVRIAIALLEFHTAAMQIPRFTEPLESLDEDEKAFTLVPFLGGTSDEFISSVQDHVQVQ